MAAVVLWYSKKLSSRSRYVVCASVLVYKKNTRVNNIVREIFARLNFREINFHLKKCLRFIFSMNNY